MNDVLEKIGAVVLGAAIGIPILIVILLIGTLVTQWSWNTFVPAIFNLPHITLWQAFALQLLARTIFGMQISTNRKTK